MLRLVMVPVVVEALVFRLSLLCNGVEMVLLLVPSTCVTAVVAVALSEDFFSVPQ
ncbi:MAG: hypothetical protein BYD32DRAFT_425295 [Podila humilis]|nr:MAG: hypothetical protein BYD32DRAFT_425295 [Podila humilis]